jgi:glycosyltransferase involved in cell wall biosynthesis
MKIAIKAAQITVGGGLTHLNKLIECCGKLAPETEFVLFGKKGQESILVAPPDNFQYRFEKLPGHSLAAQIFWERHILAGHLTKIQADLLFEPGNRGLLHAPIPKVALIHSVAPFASQFHSGESFYKRIRYSLLRQATIDSMNNSQGIIFISKSSREMLSEYIDLNSIKNTIIYHGKMENSRNENLTTALPGLPPRYLLCVSHIYRYKKIFELVQAYFRAKKQQSDIPLLLIAGTNYAPQYMNEIMAEINKSENPDSVRFLGNVPETQLGMLYRNCEAFIFPSSLEACPNILIEALSCGCAIACSDKSVMPEIADDAALYFNPDSIDEFANKIISLTTDAKLREELSRKAIERARFFSWEKTARETLAFFDEVLGNSKTQNFGKASNIKGQPEMAATR